MRYQRCNAANRHGRGEWIVQVSFQAVAQSRMKPLNAINYCCTFRRGPQERPNSYSADCLSDLEPRRCCVNVPCTILRWFCKNAPLTMVEAPATSNRNVEVSELQMQNQSLARYTHSSRALQVLTDD
jgi:hypothetical protein